jgi:hypothetical protein
MCIQMQELVVEKRRLEEVAAQQRQDLLRLRSVLLQVIEYVLFSRYTMFSLKRRDLEAPVLIPTYTYIYILRLRSVLVQVYRIECSRMCYPYMCSLQSCCASAPSSCTCGLVSVCVCVSTV